MHLNIREDIKALSDFRTEPNAVIKQIHETHRPVYITDRGKPTAVLVDLEEYERQREKMELMEAIIEGEKDYEDGRTESLKQLYQSTRQWLTKK